MGNQSAGAISLLLALSIFVTCTSAAAPPAAPDVIHQGTTDWFQAAKTGRADMLILGDSVVTNGGNGWDAGFINALSKRVGLAGTGLLGCGGAEGDGYSCWPSFGSTFDFTPAAVRADRRGYLWNARATTAGAAPSGDIVFSVDPAPLSSGNGYDVHLYAAPTGTSGTLQYWTRLGVPPYSVTTPLSSPQTVNLPAQGLAKVDLHFDRPPESPGAGMEFRLAPNNLSIFYGRLIVPGATGASVTTWGYGGQPTLSFYQDLWTGQGVTPEGRKAWFDALTEGGSGKVNLVIAEGFNDRNETRPSLQGTLPGDSAAAFGDNVGGLIQKIRDEWSASGRAANDLSFTLLGMYAHPDDEELYNYAFTLSAMAANDPQISFVNLQNHVDYDSIVAAGWIPDGTHPTRAAALAMSEMVVNALVPEPGALSLLTFGLLAMVRRRRGAL